MKEYKKRGGNYNWLNVVLPTTVDLITYGKKIKDERLLTMIKELPEKLILPENPEKRKKAIRDAFTWDDLKRFFPMVLEEQNKKDEDDVDALEEAERLLEEKEKERKKLKKATGTKKRKKINVNQIEYNKVYKNLTVEDIADYVKEQDIIFAKPLTKTQLADLKNEIVRYKLDIPETNNQLVYDIRNEKKNPKIQLEERRAQRNRNILLFEFQLMKLTDILKIDSEGNPSEVKRLEEQQNNMLEEITTYLLPEEEDDDDDVIDINEKDEELEANKIQNYQGYIYAPTLQQKFNSIVLNVTEIVFNTDFEVKPTLPVEIKKLLKQKDYKFIYKINEIQLRILRRAQLMLEDKKEKIQNYKTKFDEEKKNIRALLLDIAEEKAAKKAKKISKAKKSAATLIQKIYRGRLDRKKFQKLKADRAIAKADLGSSEDVRALNKLFNLINSGDITDIALLEDALLQDAIEEEKQQQLIPIAFEEGNNLLIPVETELRLLKEEKFNPEKLKGIDLLDVKGKLYPIQNYSKYLDFEKFYEKNKRIIVEY
jgi:hypothetical protein